MGLQFVEKSFITVIDMENDRSYGKWLNPTVMGVMGKLSWVKKSKANFCFLLFWVVRSMWEFQKI